MALDTANKRLSAIALGALWRALLPLPDGVIDAGDRGMVAGLASGPLAGASSPIVVGVRPLIVIQPDGYWFADVLLMSPGSEALITFDWSLVVGDTLALASVSHDAPGLTVVAQSDDAGSARSQVRLAGARHGRLYMLTLQATLSNDEVFERQYPVRGWA